MPDVHSSLHLVTAVARPFYSFSMCDVNALKKRGPNGGEEEAKEKQSPLHMAASWGLESVSSLLVEMGADVNARVRLKNFALLDSLSTKNAKALLFPFFRISRGKLQFTSP